MADIEVKYLSGDGEEEEETTETSIEVELLETMTLPKTIQGDGRYVMTLLNKYLEEMVVQIDLANGFSPEEISPTDGSYPTPRNFYLTFDRTGGKLTWTHLADVSNLAYYETRTDTKVGESTGLLDRTTNNYSTILPTGYVGTVYLYAMNQDKIYSNPASLTYSKARPDAPTDITVATSSEGILISFSEIPSDCIGANVYVGGAMYQTTSNLYLYTDAPELDSVEVAFYDQFGEGEHGILYLVLPDVTGLLVERNGSELDFYWDAVNVYGVAYVVKVGSRPDWDAAMELFRTKTNDKNRYLYPNTGDYYLLVKAYDEYGNYSRNAAYQLMQENELEINRNIILQYSQNEVAYSGEKINVYYDAGLGGITLEREAMRGEYIFDVHLDQRYKARNWIDYNVLSLSGGDLTWDDCTWAWDDDETMAWAGMTGNIDSVKITQQIAYYKGMDSSELFGAQLMGNLTTDQLTEPDVAVHADEWTYGRWGTALYIYDLTKLEYTIPNGTTAQFNMTFWIETTEKLSDTIFMTIANDSGEYLLIGYNSRLRKFYCRGSDGVEIYAADITPDAREWIFFGINQNATTRSLYIYSYSRDIYSMAETEAEPIGYFTTVYAYPKIIC